MWAACRSSLCHSCGMFELVSGKSSHQQKISTDPIGGSESSVGSLSQPDGGKRLGCVVVFDRGMKQITKIIYR